MPGVPASSNRLIFQKLNNYCYDDEYLEKVTAFLQGGAAAPQLADLTDNQRKTLVRRYGGKEWEIHGNTLWYTPLALEIVRSGDVETKLETMYKDLSISAGTGIVGLYQKVIQKYLGIKRVTVAAFLKNQSTYQLTKQPPMPINKPNLGLYNNHKWMIDLVDYASINGYNQKKNYILTGIDAFSKKVFAIGLVRKTPEAIIAGLETIHTEQMGGTWPVILVSDNGKEFLGEFKDWCTARHIRHIFTKTHSPQSNGLCENFNNFLRKMIRDGFVRSNSLNWTKDLPKYLASRNSTRHNRTKFTPDQVWTATNEQLPAGHRRLPAHGNDVLSKNQIQDTVEARTKAQAKATLARYKETTFNADDKVRILLAAIDTRVRKQIKSGQGKLLAVKYTPEVYRVIREYRPKRDTLQKPMYETTYGPKRFFASELQRAGEDAEDVDINMEKLNRL